MQNMTPRYLTNADARAASACLLARWRGRPTAMHPEPCAWCYTDPAELSDLLREWQEAEDARREGRRRRAYCT